MSTTLLAEGPTEDLEKWTHSGLADLLAGISAAIDRLAGPSPCTKDSLQSLAEVPLKGLDWILEEYSTLDALALEHVAQLLFEESLQPAQERPNSGGEHELYFALIKEHGYVRSVQTHGRLVSIGTLLSVDAFAEVAGARSLRTSLRAAFEKLALPTNYADLKSLGIEREHVLSGLTAIRPGGSFLAHEFSRRGPAWVDQLYGN